jgi:ribosomal-protein-alanine N-acetyltransferase
VEDRAVVLRGYRAADLKLLFELDQVCFGAEFRFSLRAMRQFLGRPGAIVVVAEAAARQGAIAGFVILHLEGMGEEMWGYVVTLDVAEEWRRQGLAGQLMREAERQARVAGAVGVGLHVWTKNVAAMQFYERSGFERGELVAGFYGGQGMDAWVFRRLFEKE